MKIIHISDLHYPETGTRPAELIGKIIRYYQADPIKPLVIITGDVLDSSVRKTHFKEARDLLQQLKQAGFPMLLCPGNHDLKAEGIGPILNGRRRFDNFFSNLLPQDANYFGEEDNNLYDFPIVHQFEDHFFIGLDSQAAEEIMGATGECGKDQLAELATILAEIRAREAKPIITIYLHHHPLEFDYRPEFLKLKDKEALLEIVTGVDMLLFGHLHFNQRFPADEKRYKIKCILLSASSIYGSKVDWAEIDTSSFESKWIA